MLPSGLKGTHRTCLQMLFSFVYPLQALYLILCFNRDLLKRPCKSVQKLVFRENPYCILYTTRSVHLAGHFLLSQDRVARVVQCSLESFEEAAFSCLSQQPQIAVHFVHCPLPDIMLSSIPCFRLKTVFGKESFGVLGSIVACAQTHCERFYWSYLN